MTQSTYDVSFSGTLAEHADITQVKINVAKLFKTDIQKIEVMFSGRRVVIKRNLDQQTALRYQAAMKNIGAICDVTENKSDADVQEAQQYSAENPPPIPPPKPVEKTQPVSEQSTQHLATEPGTRDSNVNLKSVSVGDMASITIAPAGETIMEHEKIAEPEIDISAISVDESRKDLIEEQIVPEPDIDISAISMDSSGDDLVQHEKIAEPEFDISAISLDEAGADLAVHKDIPPLEIDISNISVAPPDK